MQSPRVSRQSRFVVIATAAAFCAMAALAYAQTDSSDDEDDEIEEIVVIHSRSGDQREIRARNEELLRQRIQRELDRLEELEEEFEWRRSDEAIVAEPSRIRWGYDAERQSRMRLQSDLTDLPWKDTKPATLFRVEF